MQNAISVSLDETTTVQAGPDAPRYAQCVWCGMPVELIKDELGEVWYYTHTSDLSLANCIDLRDAHQAELDKVLNVNRKDS